MYIFKTVYPRNKGLMLPHENLCVHFFESENFSASGMGKEGLDNNVCVVVRQPNLGKLCDMEISIYSAENIAYNDISIFL
jgi:hypothetical protein